MVDDFALCIWSNFTYEEKKEVRPLSFHTQIILEKQH